LTSCIGIETDPRGQVDVSGGGALLPSRGASFHEEMNYPRRGAQHALFIVFLDSN